MTLESILLAYIDGLPIGAKAEWPFVELPLRSGSLELARNTTLEQLITAQHKLEQFHSQLLDRVSAESMNTMDYRRSYALGVITTVVKGMLDQVRSEINAFIESS